MARTLRAAISVHRGGPEDAPATYESYRAAAESGADYVELDVRMTADDVLVVHHDEHCGQHGPSVADVRYAEMCELVGYVVPHAGEAMGILAGKVAGHVDLKVSGCEREAVGLAVDAFGVDGFVVTTLEDASIARIRRAFPEVRTALALGRDLGGLPMRERTAARQSEVFPLRRLRACGAQWAALDYRLALAGVLGRCARHGIGTMLWTVDRDAALRRFLKDPRVDVVITNRPARALALRADLRGLSRAPG